MIRRFEMILTENRYKAHEIYEVRSEKSNYVVEINIGKEVLKKTDCQIKVYINGIAIECIEKNDWNFSNNACGCLINEHTSKGVNTSFQIISPIKENVRASAHYIESCEPYLLAECFMNTWTLVCLCRCEKQFKDVDYIVNSGIGIYSNNYEFWAEKLISFCDLAERLNKLDEDLYEKWVLKKFHEKLKSLFETIIEYRRKEKQV